MRVAVVGMGAAGCVAAYLLRKQHIDVQTFEALGRVGGRLHTVQAPNGPQFEAGGEWIDADHPLLLGLLNELGMEASPAPDAESELIYGNLRLPASEFKAIPAIATDLKMFEEATSTLAREVAESRSPLTEFGDLDQQTVADLIASTTSSSAGADYIRSQILSDEGDEPEHISLLGYAVGAGHYLNRTGSEMSAYRFPRGAQAFCEALLESVDCVPLLNSPLRKVDASSFSARLTFDDVTVEADHVLLTLPPPALKGIEFSPPLPGSITYAIEDFRMSRAIKIAFLFETAWWKDCAGQGNTQSEGKLQQTWDGSLGSQPCLIAYVCGKAALEWLAHPNFEGEALRELHALFPGCIATPTKIILCEYLTSPYAQGAFSRLSPGYVSRHANVFARPYGRIHFAGEHTASWLGFIEGAVESAYRAVQEITHG